MNINRITRWGIANFSIFLLAVFTLLYVWWFLVSPIDDYMLDLGTFYFGLGLLFFSAVVLTLWRVFDRLKILRLIFSTITVLSLGLTGLYLFSFIPELEQVASYNGSLYILTYHREFLGNGMSFPLLTKWDSKLRHTTNGLGETCCTLRLTSDPLSQQVSVVEIVGTTQRLAYTDSNPPRDYERDTQIGNYRYYPSWDCTSAQNHICQIYIYTVYRCTLENTGCVQLPFRYSGDYAFDIVISEDEMTHEINVYFWIGDYPGVETLIFTYGDNPQCHVAGCQILTQAGKISP
jgi:hypothetical protein